MFYFTIRFVFVCSRGFVLTIKYYSRVFINYSIQSKSESLLFVKIQQYSAIKQSRGCIFQRALHLQILVLPLALARPCGCA